MRGELGAAHEIRVTQAHGPRERGQEIRAQRAQRAVRKTEAQIAVVQQLHATRRRRLQPIDEIDHIEAEQRGELGAIERGAQHRRSAQHHEHVGGHLGEPRIQGNGRLRRARRGRLGDLGGCFGGRLGLAPARHDHAATVRHRVDQEPRRPVGLDPRKGHDHGQFQASFGPEQATQDDQRAFVRAVHVLEHERCAARRARGQAIRELDQPLGLGLVDLAEQAPAKRPHHAAAGLIEEALTERALDATSGLQEG